MPGPSTPSVGFILEQTLGHRTHAANLRSIIDSGSPVRPVWLPVEHERFGLSARLPGYGNWTVRAGVRARRAIGGAHRATPLDALFFHTQVPSVLSVDWVARIPSVVSIDATPLQYDELGASYGHARSSPWLEAIKLRASRAVFDRAFAVVAWSRWAAQGLTDEYGIPADKIHVVAPGVRVADWVAGEHRVADDVIRILFVGGDFERKGGPLLLGAFEELRSASDRTGVRLELDVVTQAPVEPSSGVTVHRGLGPNSAALRDLYHRADVFCLPTLGDCLPMVLAEAGAAGLPLVATRVGAIPELVRDGETGLVVQSGDRGALVAALERLIGDVDLRRRLGAGAAALVAREHDAALNASRLVELVQEAARSGERLGTPQHLAEPASGGSPRVLVTVSGTVPASVEHDASRGLRPRPDYLELADAFGGADILDHVGARAVGGPVGRLIELMAGRHALLAWSCLRLARRYDVIFSDGEQVGLPLAVLFRLGRARTVQHSMIVHILSVRQKVWLIKLLGLTRHIDLFLTYSSWQAGFIRRELGVPPERVVLTPFMVDTDFFVGHPTPAPADRRTICAVGLERRDYPTLLRAVDGLDVKVVIAASSPWSTRPDQTTRHPIPSNVELVRLGFVELRRLYEESEFLVMPLLDVPFQAGVTAILEAMSMGRAVICTRTEGQTDVVIDGQTGCYVPPGDADALRRAIRGLLSNPERARRMGQQARRTALSRYAVTSYAERLAGRVLGDLDATPTVPAVVTALKPAARLFDADFAASPDLAQTVARPSTHVKTSAAQLHADRP